MSAKGPGPGLWLQGGEGLWVQLDAHGWHGEQQMQGWGSSGQGELQRCQTRRRRLEREGRWLSSLFLSPPRADGSLSHPARSSLPRQSPNCLSLLSSSSGDIPDLDLCPVQRQRSAIRNQVTGGIRDCWKRPGVSLLGSWSNNARPSCLPPPQSWQTGHQAGLEHSGKEKRTSPGLLRSSSHFIKSLGNPWSRNVL